MGIDGFVQNLNLRKPLRKFSNLPVINENCLSVPFDDLPDFPKKWILFSNSADGNKGVAQFSADSETKIDLEIWFQSLIGQSNKKETYFAISIKKYAQTTDSTPNPNISAVQARLASSANVNKIVGNLKRVISLAQVEGFQRLYGKSSFEAKISAINVGILGSSYGKNQWYLLVPPSPEILNPKSPSYPAQSENYGIGIRPVPNNSLPTASNITGLIPAIQNDPLNFSEKAGVTTSTNALSATIKLLPEAAIDRLEGQFKVLSPLLANGNYPNVPYSVGNSGRAPLNFTIKDYPNILTIDPGQVWKIPPGANKNVNFKITGCPKAPFTSAPRPLYKLAEQKDTRVLPTAKNDPAMATNQQVFAEPIDAILDGSSLERTATFQTLVVCATPELDQSFDTASIQLNPNTPSTRTFTNSGGPSKTRLEAVKKFDDSPAFTSAEIVQITGWTGLQYELTVRALTPNAKNIVIATVDGKTTGILDAQKTAIIQISGICQAAGTEQFEVTLNAKNEPDTNKRIKKIIVTLPCTLPKPTPIFPPPISLEARVGNIALGSFTLENAGDIGSILDYQVYRPGQTASVQIAAVDLVQTRALPAGNGFPIAVGTVDSRFLSPSEITGSITKISVDTKASNEIPVSANCDSVGRFSSVVSVTYATGDLTPTGKPVFASSNVTVNVLCTGAVYAGDMGNYTIDLKAKNGETVTSNLIQYYNNGLGSPNDPAVLSSNISVSAGWLGVSESSSNLDPTVGTGFKITASCGADIAPPAAARFPNGGLARSSSRNLSTPNFSSRSSSGLTGSLSSKLGLDLFRSSNRSSTNAMAATGTANSGTVTLTTTIGDVITWNVNLTCIGAVYAGDPGGTLGLVAEVDQTATSNEINYFNAGTSDIDDPAILNSSITTSETWISISTNSSSLSPKAGSSFTITASCVGLEVGSYFGRVTLTTNTGKTIVWNIGLQCTGSPKVSVNPSSFSFKMKVRTSASATMMVENVGKAILSATVDTGTRITVLQSFLTIARHSSELVTVTAECGDEAGTFTSFIRVSSNDPNTPRLEIPVTIVCTSFNLIPPESAKFVSSAPSWGGNGHLSISIQNTGAEDAVYTTEYNNSGYGTVSITSGATGTIAASGSAKIDFEGSCLESNNSVGAGGGNLYILVEGRVILGIPIEHYCAGISHAAIMGVISIDFGATANVSTYGWNPGQSYGNLITVRTYSDGTIDADQALILGKKDADAHLFVPAEAWEMPCRNANYVQAYYMACRRETWASAKARFTALGYQ